MSVPSDCLPGVPPASLPLVSLHVLTCHRPSFLALALKSAAAQTYPNLEAVVVEDGEAEHTANRNMLGELAVPGKLRINHVRLRGRLSIGAKRNAALKASRGAVVAHWDDDDVHPPEQITVLACPILRNETEMSALTFSYFAMLSSRSVRFFDYRRPTAKPLVFLGTMTYWRSLATALGGSGSQGPFANVSLSEDLSFIERALDRCMRMLPVHDVPLAYVRHQRVANTWQNPVFASRMEAGEVSPPPYVDAELRAALVRAETDAATRAVCSPVAHWAPKELQYPLSYPDMPRHCCKGRSMRRPCVASRPLRAADAARDCDPNDTFCGLTKGLCTASCTCPGERGHGKPVSASDGTRKTPATCGTLCCRYWHSFWQTHAENCTSPGLRPLKRHYCGNARHVGASQAQHTSAAQAHARIHAQTARSDSPVASSEHHKAHAPSAHAHSHANVKETHAQSHANVKETHTQSQRTSRKSTRTGGASSHEHTTRDRVWRRAAI